MTDYSEKRDILAQELCGADVSSCPYRKETVDCEKFGKCRIWQKTAEQLDYIFSPVSSDVFLKACAGSGKTEALGMKAAYEISRWNNSDSGIAVLTFTNAATDTVRERIVRFYPNALSGKHFIGTVSSFIQGFITQKFAYVFRKDCEDRDRSFTIVDSDVNAYNFKRLTNYHIFGNIFVHKLNMRLSSNEWIYSENKKWGNNSETTLKNIYENKSHDLATKKYLSKSYEAFEENVLNCKDKFWTDGFATYEDMEYLAYKCLSEKSEIAKYIALKFPIIMVDEFQDLSVTELEILGYLNRAGSKIHFIGDLNQAIYSFNDALPERLAKYVEDNNFVRMELNTNFRSTQKIVDVSRKIGEIKENLSGTERSLRNCADAIYIEYSEENEAVEKFTELVHELNLKSENCVIAVRTNSHKDMLSGAPKSKTPSHEVIAAVNLWCKRNMENMKTAIMYMGKQLQKWIKYHVQSGDCYCPKNFEGGNIGWELKLRDILNELCARTELLDFEGKNYKDWYGSNRSTIAEIVCKNLSDFSEIPPFEEFKKTIRTPNGTSKKSVKIYSAPKKSEIEVMSIHSIKGKTYDALMHVSYPSAQNSKINYWENWLNGDKEERRCAYVAATRPKYLLCWAVPELDDEKRKVIEELGFEKYT